MDKKIYLSILAALATATAVWLFALLAAPIAKPMAWALIIGISTAPHYKRLTRYFPLHPNRSAGLMVLIVTLCLVLPTTALVIRTAENAVEWYQESEQLIQGLAAAPALLTQHPLGQEIVSLADRLGLDLVGYAGKVAAGVSQYLLEVASDAAKNFAGVVLMLTMALFTLFFIYRDGERLISTGVASFANNREKALTLLNGIRSTTTAVVVGTILTCLVQGLLAGLGYFVADLPAPIFWGVLTAVAAIIPVVGTVIIWAPLVIVLVIQGAFIKAGLLSLWCIVFVGFADNAIRPLAIGARSDIPVTAVVFGAVGGAASMGLLGLILGPVVFAVLVTLWREWTIAPAQGS